MNTKNELKRNLCNVYCIVTQQQKYLACSHHLSKVKTSSSSERVSAEALFVAAYLNGREISEQDSEIVPIPANQMVCGCSFVSMVSSSLGGSKSALPAQAKECSQCVIGMGTAIPDKKRSDAMDGAGL